MRRPAFSPSRWLPLLACVGLFGPTPAAQATTPCDTDPNRVLFTPTVDPTSLNKLLSRLGNQTLRTPNTALTLPGVCVNHQIPLSLGVITLPLGSAPFTVTPSLGSIQVDLDLQGPFQIGIDGGRYKAVDCDSACQIDIPYLGNIVNGCEIEAGIVGPILSGLNASVSWDDIHVTQVADTCVLGDCTAVHPLESSRVTLTNFDVDLTGFGSCKVCLPDPFPSACFDPCQGIDPVIEQLLEPVLESQISNAFVNRAGEGTLINVFSNQITKDFGCIPIPEVRNCRKGTGVAQAGLVRGPRDHGVNALFYSLPLGVAGVLALRLRRRAAPKVPPG